MEPTAYSVRFWQRLSRSVDMTSDVKSRLKIFYVFIRFFT
jgi:hypothetical protein